LANFIPHCATRDYDSNIMPSLTLQDVIDGLRRIFSHERVDVDEVKELLGSYKASTGDWTRFAMFDPHRYTRNLVDTGNGKYNLMILCWGPSMASCVHDHADAHCFVKMLQGQLVETLFDWPATPVLENGSSDADHKPMVERGRTAFEQDEVTYINDSIGLHRMENVSHTEPAVSLHVYIPAFQKCRTFDARTSKPTTCRFTFWSAYGERLTKHTSIDSNQPLEPPASKVDKDGAMNREQRPTHN